MSELFDLIRGAVRSHAKPGCGVLVSGGIDSSTVAVFAQHLPSFTGYYRGHRYDANYDERRYSRRVPGNRVRHEIPITPSDFLEHFDAMIADIEPPYQGPGTFGQWMVARYASRYVDTLLSGEGGDELFGGYARLLKVAGHPLPPGYENYRPPSDYPDTVEEALRYDWERLSDLLNVDEQATRAHGMKAVAPLLDDLVVEYVLAQPAERRVGKVMLKEVMRGAIPDVILERRDKKGFPVPFVAWAQGPLREFVLDRIGYIPDPKKPWDRQWWLDLCNASRQT